MPAGPGWELERDPDFALGVEVLIIGVKRSRGALDQVIRFVVFVVELEGDFLEVHARGVFHLADVSGVDIREDAGVVSDLVMVVLSGGIQIEGQRLRLGRSLLSQNLLLGPVGDTDAA